MQRGLITLLSCLVLTMGIAQAQTGLVSHWQGEGNPDDSAGSNNGSLQGGISYAPGQAGQAFSLDGSGYVQISHSASLNPSGGFTISAWIYPTVDQQQTVVSKWGDGGAWDNQRAYLLRTDTDGKLIFAISDDAHQWDAPFHEFSTPPGVIQLNAWNHVTAVYDRATGTRRIFVDRTEVASRQDAPITVTSSIANLAIGTLLNAPDSGQTGFSGLIDEVRFYDRAMTASELTTPVADAGPNQIANVSDTVQLDGSGSFDPGNDPLSYSWQLISQPSGSTALLSGASSRNPTLIPDVGGSYTVELVVNDGFSNSTPDQVVINAILQDGLVGYWRANDDYTDASGYTHHGQPTPGYEDYVSFGSGKNGQAFVLSQRGGVDIAHHPDLSLGFEQTISCWFKWSGTGANWQRIVGKGLSSIIRNYGLWIHPDGRYLYQLLWAGSSYATTPHWRAEVQFTAPLDTEWHHMMGTIEGQTIKLYLDGELVASDTALPPPPFGFLTDHTVRIGGHFPGTDPFSGSVDEVAIYNRALDGYSELITEFVPIARAGADQSAFTGDIVQLDGSGSSDINNDPLTYDWQLISQPGGSTASLSGATSANPTLTSDVTGLYVVQLVVNDGALDSTPDQITIDVKSPLVGYWRADNDYTDASDYNHHGQPVGSVAFSPGQEGQAFTSMAVATSRCPTRPRSTRPAASRSLPGSTQRPTRSRPSCPSGAMQALGMVRERICSGPTWAASSSSESQMTPINGMLHSTSFQRHRV